MVSSVGLYLLFLLLLGAERLFELGLSRRNLARAQARGGVERGQGHFPAMAALHGLFLLACAAEVLLLDRPFVAPLGLGSLAVAIGAQGLRYWAIAALGPQWNVRIVVVPGLAPVRSGPYRWLRHPNYVAVALELFFVPLIHGAWITALLFSTLNVPLLALRIRAEEEALGPAYAEAMEGRRRFLPTFRSSAGGEGS